jgi:hypothetical protein
MDKQETAELLDTFTLGDTVQGTVIQPRIYVNSFPKSGTHLANLICMHLAARQEPKHWLGSFAGNSWTTEWIDVQRVLGVIHGQEKGTWYQGHMGYRPEYEMAFNEMNVCMLFIHRDPRDVAVSQTYHIENPDKERACHPDKELYMNMATHEERLLAVIQGVDRFPGVMERWELYAPWLEVPWVLPVKFEDMRQCPQKVAEKAVNYVLKRTSEGTGEISIFFEDIIVEAINKAYESLGITEYSVSYRKGNVGDWQKEFTPEVKEAFKKSDINHWLTRLGYEHDEEW